MKTLLLVVLLAFPLGAAADVYKCKNPKGVVEYQGVPCVVGEQSKPQLTDSTADLSGARAYGERVRQQEFAEEQAAQVRRQAQAQAELRKAEWNLKQSEDNLAFERAKAVARAGRPVIVIPVIR